MPNQTDREINMLQPKQLDSTNAYSKVRQAIHGLIDFDFEDDRDDVLYAAYRLIAVLQTVHDNCQSWNDKAIREFVIIKNDPLRYIKVKSDRFNNTVREIQEEMVVQFS